MISLITDLDNKFQRASQQATLLHSHIDELRIRYQLAADMNDRPFRYNIRMRIMTLEGMRNMFREYALRKAKQMQHLHETLTGAILNEDFEMQPDEEMAS